MDATKLRAAAAVAWAAAAMSLGSPVDAKVRSASPGSYAAVASGYNNITPTTSCGYTFFYWQKIKFHNSGCNQNFCIDDGNWPHVDVLYSKGRKVATLVTNCSAGYIYNLGTCAC